MRKKNKKIYKKIYKKHNKINTKNTHKYIYIYDYVTILRGNALSFWFNLGLFLKMKRDFRILKLTLLLEESRIEKLEMETGAWHTCSQ